MMNMHRSRKNRVISAVAAFAFLALRPNVIHAQAVIENALPQGANVVAGAASFETTGNNLNITTSDRPIIQWNSYNIGQVNTVNYLQPASSSVALNRVTGVDPSLIYGALNASGRVFIVNPNGVFFGAGSRVDVNGLVASTLDINNADFLAGKYRFYQNGGSGWVSNQGTIIANGGYVALLSNAVGNSGSIAANLGKVALAAGEKMTVALDDAGDISVTIDDAVKNNVFGADGRKIADAVKNSGMIQADGGKVVLNAKVLNGIFDHAVNNSGVVQANSLVDHHGVIELVSSQDGIVANAGTLSAKGNDAGTTGGTVKVLGEKVGLFGGAINVSGDQGGGTVLVGGDYHGENPEIRNAARTYVDPFSYIYADAMTNGNGGKVVVWANGITRYYGKTSANGGAQAGNGGFVEISGHEDLFFNGSVYLEAPHGTGGHLLLDPNAITISTGADTNTAGFTAGTDNLEAFADDPGADSTFNVSNPGGSFVGVGNGGTIELQASTNLTVSSAFDVATSTGNSNVNLTLRAKGDITLNAAVTLSGTGALVISADDDNNNAGVFTSAAAGNITTATGNVTISGADAMSLLGTITTNGGSVSITNHDGAGGTLSIAGAISTSGGNVTLNSTDGITLSGADADVTTSGGSYTASADTDADGTGAYDQNNAGSAISTNGGDVTISGADAMSLLGTITTNGGNVSITNTDGAGGTLSIAGAISTSGGNVTLNSTDGITLSGADADVTTSGGSYTASADTDADGTGTYSQNNAGSIVSTGGGNVSITAADVALTGTLNSDTGDMTVDATTGGVTATAGPVIAQNLLLLGTGTFTLNQAGNDVSTLAANVTGALTYKDSNALTIGDVSTTHGVTTNSNAIDISTVNGTLTVSNTSAANDVDAGTSTATLTAGSSGNDNALTVDSSAKVNATGGVTLVADNLTLTGTANSGASTATIRQFENGTLIKLGSADAAGTLGLTSAELNNVTAGTLKIGDSNSGNLSVNAAISPANASTLSLQSGGTITQTAGSTITDTNLALRGTSITLNESNAIGTLAAQATAGAFSYKDTDALTIGTVDGLSGITATGDVTLTGGALTINQSISDAGKTVTLNTAGATEAAAKTITAADLLLNGTGDFILDQSNNVAKLAANVTGKVTYEDADALAVDTVGATSGITVHGKFTLETLNGDIALNNKVKSETDAVNIKADNGSISATGAGPHVAAQADSLLSVPNGTIGLTDPLDVDILGNLTLDIGGRGGLTSGILTGTVHSQATIPLLSPSSFGPPLRPPGNVFFNGVRIWPSLRTFLLSQSAGTLLWQFVFPSAEKLALVQVNTFDGLTTSSNQSGPVFLYHPLSELDSGAFDEEFHLDEGAYDYIDGQIKKKKKG